MREANPEAETFLEPPSWPGTNDTRPCANSRLVFEFGARIFSAGVFVGLMGQGLAVGEELLYKVRGKLQS